jgi:flagellar protein FlaI
MANLGLPYRQITTHDKCPEPAACEHFQKFPKPLQDAALGNIFLMKYLHKLPVDQVGAPTFRDKLARNDGESEKPNFIYPAKTGGIFLHVTMDPDGGRDWYIAIEPSLEHPSFREIMADVEIALLDYTDVLESAKSEGGLASALDWSLDRIFGRERKDDILAEIAVKDAEAEAKAAAKKTTDDAKKAPAAPAAAAPAVAADGAGTATAVAAPAEAPPAEAAPVEGEAGETPKEKPSKQAKGRKLNVPGKSGGLLGKFMGKGKGRSVNVAAKWKLDGPDVDGIKYSIIKEKVGVGVMQPLINDNYIEDISCSGIGNIFIEHKVFKSLRTAFGYASHEELDEHVLRLSERIKKPVTFRQPVVDASLPDGSRMNIVFGQDVSRRGTNYTIRKFADEPLSILQLAKWGSLSWEMAAYLSIVIEDGMNLFVSGETASGKTTLINGITTFIQPNAKIVSIEDTAEVKVPHMNWISEVTRKPKPGETDSGVGMFDLLKAALRQRPNEIIIGEIRGEEGLIAFQAMQTGHPVMATFHAASIQKLIQRLVGDPINVPKNYVDNLNIVVIQIAVRLPNGKIGRRAVSINEIVAYDSQSDAFSFVEVFKWDPVTDTFEFTGFNNSYILEQKIAVSRGYPPARRRQIYNLVKRRARILEKLADSGVLEYYEVYKVISKAIREGVF